MCPAADDVPVGNTFDKYGSSNPFVRLLMARFERNLDDLFDRAAPRSVLDFGCGEGVLTERWAATVGGRVVGVDLEHPTLAAEWAKRQRSDLEFRALDGRSALPFGDAEFELVAAIEVLEHIPDPRATLAELRRTAARWLLVSVPREPLWRTLNLARGAYLRELGNTPGHLNHWSQRELVRLLSTVGRVEQVRAPFPWTQALVAVG